MRIEVNIYVDISFSIASNDWPINGQLLHSFELVTLPHKTTFVCKSSVTRQQLDMDTISLIGHPT